MAKRKGKPVWLVEWQAKHGSGNKKIKDSDLKKIRTMYIVEKMTQQEIANHYTVSQTAIYKFLKKHKISKTRSESAKQSEKVGKNLTAWRETNDPWNKGLTKDDSTMANLIEKGRQTQIKNGKSKGKNNPMYGKLTHSKAGFRKDLGHYVRSSWEANFGRICKLLKLDYEYELQTFLLTTGETYTPDFYLPPKNKFYEIRGHEYNTKHIQFIKDYPDLKLTLVKEKFYTRLIKGFSSRIKIEDKNTLLNTDDISKEFAQYCIETKEKPSARKFCKFLGISNKTIIRMYGSESEFIEKHKSIIRNSEIEKIIGKGQEYENLFKAPLTRRAFYKFYSRAAGIIGNYFDGSFSKFSFSYSSIEAIYERPGKNGIFVTSSKNKQTPNKPCLSNLVNCPLGLDKS